MMRLWIQTVGACAAFALPVEARAGGLTIEEQPEHVTAGSVTVDATPAEVYDLVTDFARWPAILHDVTSATVESGGRRDARVRFRSRALQHQVTVVFDNQAGRAIRFRGVEGPPGGRASGTYFLDPIDGGRRTQVTAKLYMDVVGLPGLFVRGSTVRSMRQAKLRADLTDVQDWFAMRHTPQR